MKKLWKVMICLLAFWVITTAYFYLQHTVTVKMMSLPGWNLSKENPIQIKEIRLINKGDIRNDINGYIPTMFTVINKVPGETLKKFLFQTLLYYHSPYEKYKNGWELVVSGVYFRDQSNVDFLGSDMLTDKQNVKIYADGEQVFPHMFQEESGSNLVYFTIRASGVNPRVGSLKIDINMGGKFVTRTYSTKFNTKTYGFFKIIPGYYDNFSPKKVVLDGFWRTQKGQSFDSAIFQSTDLKNRLFWAKGKTDLVINTDIGYLKSYKKYKDVFTVALKCTLNKPTYRKYSVEQVFYLVMDNNKWMIIDITPFKEI